MAEMAIVYGNRYKSSNREVEIGLNEASKAFTKGDYKESLEVQMVAKEVMECHYKLIVGLISLSETVHELAHSHRLFIPVDHVIGRYKIFVELYKPFIEPEMLETLERIEKYTLEHSEIEDTSIIEQHNVSNV